MNAEHDGIVFDVASINYLSDPSTLYAKDLAQAKSLTDLKRVAAKWNSVASDATAIIEAMTQEEFETFKKGQRREARGNFAGEEFAEKYGALMMPEVLFMVTARAVQLLVPWGLVFLRMRQAGLIAVENGIATMKAAQA